MYCLLKVYHYLLDLLLAHFLIYSIAFDYRSAKQTKLHVLSTSVEWRIHGAWSV